MRRCMKTAPTVLLLDMNLTRYTRQARSFISGSPAPRACTKGTTNPSPHRKTALDRQSKRARCPLSTATSPGSRSLAMPCRGTAEPPRAPGHKTPPRSARPGRGARAGGGCRQRTGPCARVGPRSATSRPALPRRAAAGGQRARGWVPWTPDTLSAPCLFLPTRALPRSHLPPLATADGAARTDRSRPTHIRMCAAARI